MKQQVLTTIELYIDLLFRGNSVGLSNFQMNFFILDIF